MIEHEHPTPVPTVTIELTVRLELAPDQVWPDDDVPKDWGPEDVVKRVEDAGTLERFIRDWGADGAEVGVHARARYARGWLR